MECEVKQLKKNETKVKEKEKRCLRARMGKECRWPLFPNLIVDTSVNSAPKSRPHW